ncbi:hypothetical protein H2200_012379 [Cladophialophora chaetospira]|uniref:Uncharacterized protein n=1 Tax=Cladophialophora chaetospira TaxID=386627 RepID=A0AA38WXS3_9EURO|nr:hypothetical protein H2200_012379 [Cladophialophora chaetospira]
MSPPLGHKHAPKAQKLLFINKGVESGQLSRSGTPNEAFRINSFVQNRRRRRESSRGHTSTQSSPDNNESHSVAPNSMSPVEQIASEDMHALIRDFDHHRSTMLMFSSVRPTNNTLDPFNAAVVPINAKTLQFLQYAFSTFSRRTFRAEALPPQTKRAVNMTFRHDDFLRNRLERCIDDKMVMDSTLAVGVTCAGWTIERPDFEKPLELFLGRAINAVRTHLASSHTDSPTDRQWVILSVYSLSISTFWLALARTRGADDLWTALSEHETVQSLDAAVLHLNVARNLIAELGGPLKLEPYILSSLILGDKYLAISRMQPPILALDWDPGRVPQATFALVGDVPVSVGHLGTRLIRTLETHGSSASLRSVILDISDYMRVSRSIWHKAGPDNNTEQWLFLRAQALFHRLLSLRDLALVEECIRSATVNFLLSFARYQGLAVSIKLVVPQLAELVAALECSDIANDPDVQGIMFWALCIAGVTSIVGEYTDGAVYLRLQAQATIVGNVIGLAAESSLKEHCDFLAEHLFLPDEQELELRRFLSIDIGTT